jgi:Raf kinase inhibitor-like YbhB/YbcL family protein
VNFLSLNPHPALHVPFLALVTVGTALILTACAKAASTPTPAAPQDAVVLDLPVFSDSLTSGAPVPVQFTCDGADRSPHLRWGEPPPGTKSFAVVMDDPDAPRGVFTHLLVYSLLANARSLPEGVERLDRLDNGAAQGKNDAGTVGYRGPCPPQGPAHEYRFYVYALDQAITLPPGASVSELLIHIRGHALAVGILWATYQRR